MVSVAPPPLAPLVVGSPMLPRAGSAILLAGGSGRVEDLNENRRRDGSALVDPSRSFIAVVWTRTGAPGRYQIGDVHARSWTMRSRPPAAGSLDAHPGASVCQSAGLLCRSASQS